MGEHDAARHPPSEDDDLTAGADTDSDAGDPLASGESSWWAFSLSRGEKLRRGGRAALLVAAVAFLLLGGPGALFSALSGSMPFTHVRWASLPAPRIVSHSAQPALSLGEVRLPPGTARTSSLHVSPSNTPNGSAYACWVNSDAQAHGAGVGALHFATLSNPSAQWLAHAPPERDGNSCYVAADSTAPNRVLFALWQSADAAVNCTLPALYVSEDVGHSWRAVSWAAPSVSACLYSLSFTQGQIYALADAPLLPASQMRGSSPAHFVLTADFGRSWRALDHGFADMAMFYVVGIRPGGHLLVQSATQAQQRSSLYESDNDGASWRALGQLPASPAQIYVSSDPNATGQGGFGRLYLIGRQPADATGAGAAPYYAWAALGGPWTPIAPPPMSSGSVSRVDNPIVTADVGPGDSLVLTLATALDSTGSPGASPALWSFDPATTRWARQPYDIPLNSSLQGHSWSNGHMMAWLLITSSGAPQVAEIQTYVLPVGPS